MQFWKRSSCNLPTHKDSSQHLNPKLSLTGNRFSSFGKSNSDLYPTGHQQYLKQSLRVSYQHTKVHHNTSLQLMLLTGNYFSIFSDFYLIDPNSDLVLYLTNQMQSQETNSHTKFHYDTSVLTPVIDWKPLQRMTDNVSHLITRIFNYANG